MSKGAIIVLTVKQLIIYMENYSKEQLMEMTKDELIALCPNPPAKNYNKDQISNLVLALQEATPEVAPELAEEVQKGNFTREFVQDGVTYIKTYNERGDSLSVEVKA